MFIDEKALNMPKVSKLCTEICTTCVSQRLNILCLIYTNLPHPYNHAKLAVMHKFKLIFIQHTVKYQQSLTYMLSLAEIRHRHLSSFCIHNRHQSF